MPSPFASDIVDAVIGHMNNDHAGDNVLIVRAFGGTDAVADARMMSFDDEGGEWTATRSDGTLESVRVSWPHAPITERGEVRREIVALYDAACAHLGVEPRPHA